MDIIIDADLATDQGIIVLCLPLIPHTCMTARHYGRLIDTVSQELLEATDEVTTFAAKHGCRIVGSPVQVFPSSIRYYRGGKGKRHPLLGVTLRCSPSDRAEELVNALVGEQDESK